MSDHLLREFGMSVAMPEPPSPVLSPDSRRPFSHQVRIAVNFALRIAPDLSSIFGSSNLSFPADDLSLQTLACFIFRFDDCNHFLGLPDFSDLSGILGDESETFTTISRHRFVKSHVLLIRRSCHLGHSIGLTDFLNLSGIVGDAQGDFSAISSRQSEKKAFHCFLLIGFVGLSVLPFAVATITSFRHVDDRILNTLIEFLHLLMCEIEKFRGFCATKRGTNTSSICPFFCCIFSREVVGSQLRSGVSNSGVDVLVSSLLFAWLNVASFGHFVDRVLSDFAGFLWLVVELLVVISSINDILGDRDHDRVFCLCDSVVTLKLTTIHHRSLQRIALADLFRLRGGSNPDFETVGSRLVRYRGSSRSVVIPKWIKVLGESCFTGEWHKVNALESIAFESESQLTEIKALCFSHCSLKSICIPRNVEILPNDCFRGSKLESITFENESRLKRIEKNCFENCSLKSICIPPNVDFIDGSAFLSCKCQSISIDPNNHRLLIDRDFLIDKIDMRLIRYFGSLSKVHIWNDIKILGKSCFCCCHQLESIIFGNESRLVEIDEKCFYNCSLKSICIPRNVEILLSSCFENAKLESITFESESQLMRIEYECFRHCPLKSICIPRNVDFIDGSAFTGSKCQSIFVDPNNRRFSVDQKFLIDKIDQRLIRYFGSTNRVHIWNEVEILGISCFEGCRDVELITFGSESRLMEIDALCFSECSFKTICIPGNVEILGARCFRCSELEIVTFENESRLAHIEVDCFAECLNLDCIDVLAGADPARIKGSLDAFHRVKRLIEEQMSGIAICIRFDVGCGDIEIPVELRALIHNGLHFHASFESLTLPIWIEVIGMNDFRACRALRNVIVERDSCLLELHGFRDCPSLEAIEVRSGIEIVGRDAFTHSIVSRHAERRIIRRPIFVVTMNEGMLRRSRHRSHMFMHRGTRMT
jgi:hypothetical protein